MLSILIPIYNFDVRELVQSLSKQAIKEGVEHEIILIDDASEDRWKTQNRILENLANVSYTESEQNMGRSRIRNKLADKAAFDNLLFLDCDSAIQHDDFIRNYLQSMNTADVVTGGTEYLNSILKPEYSLHWTHGKKREQAPAAHRNSLQNRSFQTNNFLIKADILRNIRFDEKIRRYGHEDTLFGIELKALGKTISHIDNPVVHLGLEPNDVFLNKTRESLKNLRDIVNLYGEQKPLADDITILHYYQRMAHWGLDRIMQFIYKHYEHRMRRNLLSTHPNLMVFDLYKLGYLCSLNGK